MRLQHQGNEGDMQLRSIQQETKSSNSSRLESKFFIPSKYTDPQSACEIFKDVPLLRNTPKEKLEQVFTQKLLLCSINFDFSDAAAQLQGKEMKRNTLLEMVDYVNQDSGQLVFLFDGMMLNIVQMVRKNLVRSLNTGDPEMTEIDEEDSISDPSWPHLQVVYEFFLRFVVSQHVNAKVAKSHGGFDQALCATLVALFDSDDPREREYLKTIVHRVYGKFMNHRPFLRRALANTFLHFAHVSHHHNGISELLEILGSIVNGFALPLKSEHLNFLRHVLLPLHAVPTLHCFHQQFVLCLLQYIEKDPDTSVCILRAMFSYWPWSQSSKQLLFLQQLEEILQHVSSDHYRQVRAEFVEVLSRSAASKHFQVVERTYLLWNNETVVHKCLALGNSAHILPRLFSPLFESATDHWNCTVRTFAAAIIALYQNENPVLWEDTKREATKCKQDSEAKDRERLELWAMLEAHMSST